MKLVQWNSYTKNITYLTDEGNIEVEDYYGDDFEGFASTFIFEKIRKKHLRSKELKLIDVDEEINGNFILGCSSLDEVCFHIEEFEEEIITRVKELCTKFDNERLSDNLVDFLQFIGNRPGTLFFKTKSGYLGVSWAFWERNRKIEEYENKLKSLKFDKYTFFTEHKESEASYVYLSIEDISIITEYFESNPWDD